MDTFNFDPAEKMEKPPVMDIRDALSVYDPAKDEKLKNAPDFRKSLAETSFLGKAEAGLQRIGWGTEQVPTGMQILWGQANIAAAATTDWAVNALGAAKPLAEIAKNEIGIPELRKRGEQLIISASRNLEELRKYQQEEAIPLEDEKNVVTMASAALGQIGTLIAVGLVPAVGPALSVAAMASLEASGTAIEGLEQYKQEHPEDKELKGFTIDEKSAKEFYLNVAKTFVNGCEEYVLGVGGQARRIDKMAKLAKHGFKPQRFGGLKYVAKHAAAGAAEEFTEEALLQGTSDTIFDYMLGRYKDKDEAIAAWKENLADSVYAGLAGGVAGMGGAIYARTKGIAATKEILKNVVPEESLDAVATTVFENELNEVLDVATVAVEVSSQLKAQKGAVYDALRSAAFQAAKESGGYKGLSDESLWAHVNEVSERFSQEAIAEAFKRNVPIQEVIDSNDIVYKDGELHLAKVEGDSNLGKKIKQAVQKKAKLQKPKSLLTFLIQRGGLKDSGGELAAMDARTLRPGIVNNKYGLDLDRARELAAEAGYFGHNPQDDIANTTVADFIELLRTELNGEKVYTPEGTTQAAQIQQQAQAEDTDEAEYYYESKLEQYGVDYSNMTFDEKRDAAMELEQMEQETEKNYTGPSDEELEKIFGPSEDVMFQESMDLAEEMAAIDANNDAYTGETVNINGVEKTVYNSNGDRIAKSEEALRAFYNWFGDSKVVDEQGRPLVVYHGTNAEFDTFKKIERGVGYWFGPKQTAEEYAKERYEKFGGEEKIYPVYLKLEKIADISTESGRNEIKSFSDEFNDKELWNYARIPDGNIASFVLGNMDFAEFLGGEKGYDGIKMNNGVYVSYFRENIKSTDNRGTFSLEDDNIYNQWEDIGSKTRFSKSQSDLKQLMSTFPPRADYRLMYDAKKGYWFVADSMELIHEDILKQAFRSGLYPEFNSESEVRQYFDEKTYEDDGTLSRFVAKGYENNNYMEKINEMSDDYSRAYIIDNGNGNGVVLFARYESDLDDAGISYLGENAKLYDIVNKVFIDQNTYNQSAYHGSPNKELEGGKFDLKYAGKTTGNVHGHGVYAVVSKPSAEYWAGENGQVYELNVPEDFELIDEQKRFNEQPEKVQWAILAALEKIDGFGLLSKAIEEDSYGGDIYVALGKDVYADKHRGIEGGSTEIMKAASEFLDKIGIKGITYNYADEKNFVIFNPDDVKVIQKFYQVEGLKGAKPVQRGSYNANSKVIKLFEAANTATLPHELAHYWLDNMWTYAQSGQASPQYAAQFNAVKEFLGVNPEQENLTRAQHEKFASAYEKYLYRGVFPNPMMGTVFANYERFIRDVYQSINDIREQGKSKVRLTPEIIKFFDSMVTGELPAVAENVEMVNEAKAEQVHQYDSKVVEEVKKEVVQPTELPTPVQEPAEQEILPVGSSGKVAESRLAKRTAEATGLDATIQYERANMENERQKAAEMWKNDPQKAQAELKNATIGNDVLRSALYTEQQRIALEKGDTQTFLNSVRKQSAEATRAGQEIAALRGVMEDITIPTYWIRLAEYEAQKQLAKNMATFFDKVMGNTPLTNFTQKFDADVKALYEKVQEAKTSAEKNKIMKDGLEQMKKTYRGLNQQEVGELFQTDWTNEELAYDYVEKKARDAIGLNLTNEKANAIIQASRDLDTLSRDVDEFGIPKAPFFAKKAELEYMINSHTPSSQIKVLLSTLGRANMLTAPATSVLNVASNVQNYGAQKAVRMIQNKITGHTNENFVDADLAKGYRKRIWDTFWATGYDIAMMNSITDTRLYRGESAVNSAGEGVLRKAGQWAEKHVFGELISSPDMLFKSYLAFTDFLGNEATDVAIKEGLTGEKAKQRANQLFVDATKIEPTTEIGQQIRAKAQADALVVTFQQETKLARSLLDLRNLVNRATGDIGVGDLLSAFVKTPANVLALGYDATVGPFGHLVNTFGAIQDARAGNLTSARVMATIRQTTTMAVMQAIVAAFALCFIDDDDYIPDYSQLSPSERRIVKERGGSFGSILIGDTYISTDFFGPFEVPLVAWLNARRQKGFADKASAYIGSVIRKGMDAPVIKDLMDQAKAAEEVGSDSLSIWEHLYNTAGNLLISRLTPNVMNTLAKMTDDYERETNRSVINKLISRVPFARETLEPKISVATGKPVETPSALMQLFFGSRAHKKVDNAVVNELYRLYKQGEKATISDITSAGDLKLIDDKDKPKAKEWFAKEYSAAASKLIKSNKYLGLSDEDKKSELNKIRKDLVKQLKNKYKEKISVEKRKK